jgi:hypothetical protein
MNVERVEVVGSSRSNVVKVGPSRQGEGVPRRLVYTSAGR